MQDAVKEQSYKQFLMDLYYRGHYITNPNNALL